MQISTGIHARVALDIIWRYPELCYVGRHSIIDAFCYISCALQVGKFTHISANCTFLGGGVKVWIGDFVNIGPGCRIVSASQDYWTDRLSGPCIPDEYDQGGVQDPVHIGDFCLLGTNTVILPGVKLPKGVATGAGAVLKPRVYTPWAVYVGSPARIIGFRSNCGFNIEETANEIAKAYEHESD